MATARVRARDQSTEHSRGEERTGEEREREQAGPTQRRGCGALILITWVALANVTK